MCATNTGITNTINNNNTDGTNIRNHNTVNNNNNSDTCC